MKIAVLATGFASLLVLRYHFPPFCLQKSTLDKTNDLNRQALRLLYNKIK